MKNIFIFLFAAALFTSCHAQNDSLKNCQIIGQISRNQKVGSGLQVGSIGSPDTAMINGKFWIPSLKGNYIPYTDANGFFQNDSAFYRNITGFIPEYIERVYPSSNPSDYSMVENLGYDIFIGSVGTHLNEQSFMFTDPDTGIKFVYRHHSYIFPKDTAGTAGQLLTTDGNNPSAALYWSTPGGGSSSLPAGRVAFGASDNTITSDTGLTYYENFGVPELTVLNGSGSLGQIITGNLILRGVGQVEIDDSVSTNTYNITLPGSQGGAGTTLINDGTGQLSWQAPAAANIFTDSIHLSSAQLLAMNVTPVQLEPGIPGHNYQIISIREDNNFVTSPYSGGALLVSQDNTLTGELYFDNNISNSASVTSGFMSPLFGTSSANAVRGDALTIYANGALTGGFGSVDIFVTYTIR